jgi:hypothetical protein
MSEAVSLLRALGRGPVGMLRRDSAVGPRDLALDLLAFAETVACATVFRWQARDVIWGLWISSLTVGYATIVSNVVRGVRTVLGSYRVLAVVGGLGTVARSTASFWPLIVASFLSRLSDIFPGSPAPSGKDSFAAPYANVIRMHLLIFVFAGLHVADLSRLAILPVLAAYFFPWKAVFRRTRGNQGGRGEIVSTQ